MPLQAPSFWWQKIGWKAAALWPISTLYGHIAARRMARKDRYHASIPVLCIGNFTLGGAGKTPTALALAKAAIAMGLKPGFLSRGYGGTNKGTLVVDPLIHSAHQVGDEPLLLAAQALTVISPRRKDGAKALEAQSVDLIIMDDGFQSAQLHVDLALLVVDSRKGAGNGFVFPAGPLRAPLTPQFAQMHTLLNVGTADQAMALVRRAARAGKPVLNATIRAFAVDPRLQGRVLAYAGIADPEKFYASLREIGADIVITRSFGDHQALSSEAIADLLKTADHNGLQLVTTAKDLARLQGSDVPNAQDLMQKSMVLEIEMAFDDPSAPGLLVRQAMEAGHSTRRTRFTV
ncbi:tetraacyldisaccharide 4'-kinase [Allorhizobium terrae]|uniref:Tetraacyldisaccharide 4'-kinase n=1 Tax=Allorhizobium terrae TaxID=1848972 RepID=A0A4V3W8E3_9HYPH|nr:tetraacyldisaccharide 4'-kinase [Allorhizobium terrae]THF50907.1 tetraacyldisaccharide 4'-kinase [Allorhizobium terrae]